MDRMTLAVLMACYNRREKTLACLQALYMQELDIDIHLDVYLVDDGSSDGTWDAIQAQYPSVKLLKGTGSLFWVGGMRLAFAEALQHDYDYYLWLNDDTILEPHALNTLFLIHHELLKHEIPDSIVVGSTYDRVTGEPTYGGVMRPQHWYSNRFLLTEPSHELKQSDTMNGNCVLIPRSVAAKVGNIDAALRQKMGDLDYGLRARQLGCSVWMAPGYAGMCSRNPVEGSWVDTSLSLRERLKRAFRPKGFPIRAWTVFVRRHAGPFWYFYWILPYVRGVIGYKDLRTSWFREKTAQDSLQSQ